MPPALKRLLRRPAGHRPFPLTSHNDLSTKAGKHKPNPINNKKARARPLARRVTSQTQIESQFLRKRLFGEWAPELDASYRQLENGTDGSIVRKQGILRPLRVQNEWEELDFQSDVTANDGCIRRVDSDEEKENWELWASLLEFSKRIYGDTGVKNIWNGIRNRDLDLPTTGKHAERLWTVFVTSDSYLDVWKHALELYKWKGLAYEPLYESIVGHLLANGDDTVLRLHQHFLRVNYPIPAGALSRLAPIAIQNSSANKLFREIYRTSKERGIYDSIITTLHAEHKFVEAMTWHKFLARYNDHPSTNLIANNPKLAEFTRLCNEMLLPHHKKTPRKEKRQKNEDVVTSPQAVDHVHDENLEQLDNEESPPNSLNREIMSHVLGRAHGIVPKPLDDRFVARLFATEAFSINVVVSGLSIIGIETIGPLAFRELAARMKTPNKILESISDLRKAGIAVGDSVFTSVVEKLASDNRPNLLNAILTGDQHPEVYEDKKLQLSLLESYLERRDWPNVHRTLIILTAFHADSRTHAWNLLLQARARTWSLRHLTQIVDDMRLQNINISKDSLFVLCRLKLRPRRPGRRPQTSSTESDDELAFLANIWRYALESGGTLNPIRWKEILKRYGMSGRLVDLTKLCLWLVEWYKPKSAHPVTDYLERRSMLTGNKPDQETLSNNLAATLHPSNPLHPWHQLFSPAFQRALVAWGFQTGLRKTQSVQSKNNMPRVSPDNLTIEPLRGLYLLQQLWQQGVYVQRPLVQKILKQRLVSFFGPKVSNRRRNRRDRRLNEYTLEELIAGIEWSYDWKMFNLPEELKARLVASVLEKYPDPLTLVHIRDKRKLRSDLLLHIFGPVLLVRKTRDKQAIDTAHWARTLDRLDGGIPLGRPARWDRHKPGFKHIDSSDRLTFRQRGLRKLEERMAALMSSRG